MSRSNNNKKIAEFLGWRDINQSDLGPFLVGLDPEGESRRLPDFYEDEEANALLFDHIIEETRIRFSCKNWLEAFAEACDLIVEVAVHDGLAERNEENRKTAVCAAFLKLM